MDNQKYWLGFNHVAGVGPAKLKALLDYFGDIQSAWAANESALKAIGIDKRTRRNLFETRARIDLDAEMARVARAGATLLTKPDAAYPKRLLEIYNSPPTLYMKGTIEPSDSWAVAIVGTRRLTSYGRQVTRELAAGLARNGVTIVSGLARGIDALAHQTAVDVGGRTIAVLGSGIDFIYPPENRQLAAQIIDGHGAVVTEYAMGVAPERKNFPPRNRIISGLSLGTIVIEAAARSGALITTNFAMEQGREVFAVPGPITSASSKGCNRLIQQGAKLVSCVEDVLEELNLSAAPQQQAMQMTLPESAEEAVLLAHLSAEPIHIDELSRKVKLPASMVSGTLTMMELKGMVQQTGRMMYVLMR